MDSTQKTIIAVCVSIAVLILLAVLGKQQLLCVYVYVVACLISSVLHEMEGLQS